MLETTGDLTQAQDSRRLRMDGGVGHAHRMSGRRAGGAVLRDCHEAARPSARHRRDRAQPAQRYLRLGRGAVGRDAYQPRRRRSRERRGDSPSVRLLGRHCRVPPGHGDALVRPRLLRHRPQATARHPAGAGTGAGRGIALRDRDRQPRALSRLRPDRRRRRRQLQGARRAGARVQAGHRRARLQVHLARHAREVRRRLHIHLRGDASTAGSGPTPTSSMRTPRPSSSSAPRPPGAAPGFDSHGPGGDARRRARRSSPTTSAATVS